MKEKRVSADGVGGTRRHDDPPGWLNMALPLELRRTLLDRAIKKVSTGQQQQQGETPKK